MLEKIVEKIDKIGSKNDLVTAVLYGSSIKKDLQEATDLDLFFIVSERTDSKKFEYLLNKELEFLNKKLDITYVTSEELDFKIKYLDMTITTPLFNGKYLTGNKSLLREKINKLKNQKADKNVHEYYLQRGLFALDTAIIAFETLKYLYRCEHFENVSLKNVGKDALNDFYKLLKENKCVEKYTSDYIKDYNYGTLANIEYALGWQLSSEYVNINPFPFTFKELLNNSQGEIGDLHRTIHNERKKADKKQIYPSCDTLAKWLDYTKELYGVNNA